MRKRSYTGWLLVGAQFLLIFALLTLAAQTPFPGIVQTAIAAIFVVDGLSLFVLTLLFNRPGNWDVHPEPLRNGKLVTGGPYKWIRHPMYAAIVLVATGVLIYSPGAWTIAAAMGLLAVLTGKIRIEEELMAHAHTGWRAYAAGNWRLVPWIW